MKKIVLFFVSLTVGVMLYAQTNAIKQYIETYKEIAINEMIRSGVPASITLAQGIVESQAGQSELCQQSNNHFGIKCKDEWTGPYVLHDDDRRNECFRVYGSAAESFKDHSDFLKNRPYYTELFTLDPADYKAWAKGLKKAGYATERDYPQVLIKIIEANELQQYSLIALERMKHKDDPTYAVNNTDNIQSTQVAASTTNSDKTDNTAIAAGNNAQPAVADDKEEADVNTANSSGPAPVENAAINTTSYPEGVFTINETKVIYAKAGTSLLALASNYNIALKTLLDFNELDKADILGKDMLIFLERKPKKGGKDYHVVVTAETIEEIAQKEGVRLESLLQYNTLQKGRQPAAGTKILLRIPGQSSKSHKA